MIRMLGWDKDLSKAEVKDLLNNPQKTEVRFDGFMKEIE